MGIIVRQSIKSVIITYLGVAIGYVSVLFLQPFVLKPEQIGLFRVLTDAALILAFFAQLGLPNVAVKFFPYFKDTKSHHHGFLPLLIATPIIGIIVFGLLIYFFEENIISLFIDNSPLFVDYFLMIIPLGAMSVYFNILESYAKVNLRIVVPNLLRQIVTKLLFIFILLLYFFQKIDFTVMVYLFIINHLLVIILFWFYIVQQGWIYLKTDFKFLGQYLGRIVDYGLFSIIGGMTMIVFFKIDVLMLSAMDSLANTGIYSIAFFIATVIEMPKRMLGQIASPIVSSALKDKDFVKVNDLYVKTSINQLITSGFLFILIWVNIDNLFYFIPKTEIYSIGKYVVLFVAIGKLIDIATGINDQIISNSAYYRFGVYVMLVLLPFTIVMNYYLIPVYSITGAAAGTAISLLLFNLVKLLFIWKKFNMQPFTMKTVIFLVLVTVAFIVGTTIPNIPNPMLDILVRSIVMFIVFGPAIYFFRLSNEINQIIDGLLRKITR